jgi:hypothetical protein
MFLAEKEFRTFDFRSRASKEPIEPLQGKPVFSTEARRTEAGPRGKGDGRCCVE